MTADEVRERVKWLAEDPQTRIAQKGLKVKRTLSTGTRGFDIQLFAPCEGEANLDTVYRSAFYRDGAIWKEVEIDRKTIRKIETIRAAGPEWKGWWT